MTAVALVLLPLIVSGLGFLCYRHPPIARRIIMYLMATVFAITLIALAYLIGSNNAYKASREQLVHLTNTDSIGSSIKIDSVAHDFKVERFLIDKERQGINLQVDINESNTKELSGWAIGVWASLFVMLLLSFMFDDIHNKKRIGSKD